MKNKSRRKESELKLIIVQCQTIFQGVPPLYESGPKGQDQIIESFIHTTEKNGWKLKDQDGNYYVFRKEGNLRRQNQ